MKQLLSQEEAMVPALFYNMKRALLPLMDAETYETMRRITDRLDGKGDRNADNHKAMDDDEVGPNKIINS